MLSPKIIGGVFGWEFPARELVTHPPKWQNGTYLRLVNARSAICILVEYLQPSNIWLPAYLCDSILLGLKMFKEKVHFYPISDTFEVLDREWLKKVASGDLVLVIDYFGWRLERSTLDLIHATGAIIVEDASQALLTHGVGEGVDYSLYSPRKFLPLPDGGILRAEGHSRLPEISLQGSPDAWWHQAFQAIILRGEFDRHKGDRSWFQLFQDSEKASPIGSYAMSEFTERALRFAFDYDAIAFARVRNFQFLAEHLDEIAVFRFIIPGIVPLGFPVRLSGRDRVRQQLFKHEIFPAIHWAIPDTVPMEFAESRKLSSEIMTLPCDQRYGIDDMTRMVAIILETLNE